MQARRLMLVQLIFMENSPTIPLEVSIGLVAISCGDLRIANPVFYSKNWPSFLKKIVIVNGQKNKLNVYFDNQADVSYTVNYISGALVKADDFSTIVRNVSNRFKQSWPSWNPWRNEQVLNLLPFTVIALRLQVRSYHSCQAKGCYPLPVPFWVCSPRSRFDCYHWLLWFGKLSADGFRVHRYRLTELFVIEQDPSSRYCLQRNRHCHWSRTLYLWCSTVSILMEFAHLLVLLLDCLILSYSVLPSVSSSMLFWLLFLLVLAISSSMPSSVPLERNQRRARRQPKRLLLLATVTSLVTWFLTNLGFLSSTSRRLPALSSLPRLERELLVPNRLKGNLVNNKKLWFSCLGYLFLGLSVEPAYHKNYTVLFFIFPGCLHFTFVVESMPSPLHIDNILYAIFEQIDVISLTHCIGVSRLFASTGSSSRLWKRHVAERRDKLLIPDCYRKWPKMSNIHWNVGGSDGRCRRIQLATGAKNLLNEFKSICL